jgi:hypothetical protein
MTIVYLCNLSEEASELRDELEEAGFDVAWGTNALDVYEYREFGPVVILYEPEFEHVATELTGKFDSYAVGGDVVERLLNTYPQESGAI